MAEGKAEMMGLIQGVNPGGGNGQVMPHDEAAFANMTV